MKSYLRGSYLQISAVIILMIFASLLTVLLAVPLKIAAEEDNADESIYDFIDAYDIKSEIEYTKTMRDLAGNEFTLYEFEGGAYAVYSTGEVTRFIEGSDEDNSPCYGIADKEIFYFGPLSYFYLSDEGKMVDAVFGTEYDPSVFAGMEYDYEEIAQTYEENVAEQPTIQPMSYIETGSDGVNYTMVDNAYYFEEITKYPENVDGSCAITALCILLGYYDTFVHDGFVPDEHFKKQTMTVSDLNQADGMKVLPGVNDSLRDLIMEEYMDYLEIIDTALEWVGKDSGYPMDNYCIKNTVSDYLDGETEISHVVEHHHGTIVNTHKNPRSYIEKDIPTLLILSDYNYADEDENGKKAGHVVVAYGFNEANDTFIANYGWSGKNRVLLDEYTAYGYYAMEFTGALHEHSSNALVYHEYSFLGANFRSTYGKCGCGTYSIESLEMI